MIETPWITESDAQLAAVIRLTVPREQIRDVMGPALNELLAALAAGGLAPAGPWFTHHLRLDPAVFDFEVGIPTLTPVTAVGRVEPGGLPAAKVARTVYRGGYEGLAAAWGEFDAWVAANGHTPAGHVWECYAVGPETSPDPAKWRTQLVRPLVTAGAA